MHTIGRMLSLGLCIEHFGGDGLLDGSRWLSQSGDGDLHLVVRLARLW